MGLPWVATLMQASPEKIAKGSFMLADWLIETRSAANSADLSAQWQEVVDSLENAIRDLKYGVGLNHGLLAANSADLSAQWQEVVDSLVVEGVTRLAPYSE